MRGHSTFGDTVIAVILALLDLISLSGRFPQEHPLAYAAVGLLLLGPTVVRRRYPLVSAYVIAAGGWLQIATHGGAGQSDSLIVRPADLALGLALYTLVAYVSRRRALEYAGMLVIGTGIFLTWRVPDSTVSPPLGLGGLAIFGFCWVLGEFVGARRAYHAEVEARVRLLETERDQHARIAVGQERTRIARELHDVVAHAVSVIVVQADGAGYAIRTDPTLAETAVRTISDTGREALIELRRLLDVLRGDAEGADPAERAPQPGVAALPELADKVTGVGLPVRLVFRGDLSGLPTAVGLGVYRIVQESLTNALKYAGHSASATVRVERVGGLVELEVTDDGSDAVTSAPPVPSGAPEPVGRTPSAVPAVSGGNGLIGMRERASVLGGELLAGRRPDGPGWRVRATFPVRVPDPDPAG